MTIPKLVKLHSPKFRFNSGLWPRAASSRTSSISLFVFNGIAPSCGGGVCGSATPIIFSETGREIHQKHCGKRR